MIKLFPSSFPIVLGATLPHFATFFHSYPFFDTALRPYVESSFLRGEKAGKQQGIWTNEGLINKNPTNSQKSHDIPTQIPWNPMKISLVSRTPSTTTWHRTPPALEGLHVAILGQACGVPVAHRWLDAKFLEQSSNMVMNWWIVINGLYNGLYNDYMGKTMINNNKYIHIYIYIVIKMAY